MNDRRAIDPLDELRSLAGMLSGLDTAVAETQWVDTEAMRGAVASAQSALALRDVTDIGVTAARNDAEAAAIASVGRARVAVAEAVLAVEQARRGSTAASPGPGYPLRAAAAVVVSIGRGIGEEVRHIAADKPRSILLRVVITVAIALSLVAAFHVVGMKRYDLSGLTLYLFSAVVGSVICTNSLCFEAERIRTALARGQRLWRILAQKNLAMLVLITTAGLPIVAALTWVADAIAR